MVLLEVGFRCQCRSLVNFSGTRIRYNFVRLDSPRSQLQQTAPFLTSALGMSALLRIIRRRAFFLQLLLEATAIAASVRMNARFIRWPRTEVWAEILTHGQL